MVGRRGFLTRGTVVGMAGALLGLGSSEALATPLALDFPSPSCHAEWVPLPDPRTYKAERVDLSTRVTAHAGYDWPEGQDAPKIVEDRSIQWHITVDGKPYLIHAFAAPEEGG